MDKAAFKAKVIGIVQGVGFRYYTRHIAADYGVTGYVKNLPDGSVEVYAEGERDILEQFLTDLRRGPSAAVVDRVEIEWLTPENKYRQFSITF